MNKGFLRTVVRIIGPALCSVGLAAWPAEADSLNSAPLAYVTNLDDSTVSVLDTSTNNVVATVPVPCRPKGVVISPDDAFAYVNGETCISVIATATNTVVATFAPVGRGGIAITPDGNFLYAIGDGRPGNVSVLATAMNTGSVVATIPVGGIAQGVSISPDGASAYVANNGDNTVSVIDTTTRTVVATVPVGGGPFGLSVTPDGALVYVANEFQGGVSVIATATNRVVATVDVPGITPTGVALTPDGTFAYVTSCDGTVAVVATATNTAVAKIPVGSCVNTFEGVAFTPDGAFAYVTNTYTKTVSVIDTAALRVVATIPVGAHSAGIAIQRKFPLRLSPTRGGNVGAVTLNVFGTGFPVGLTAKLTCGGQPDILGTNSVVTPSGTTLTSTFDLTGTATGPCVVVLTRPDGSTVVVPKPFTIEQGGAPNISVDIIGWDRIRAGREQAFYLLGANSGSIDAENVGLFLLVPTGMSWRVDSSVQFTSYQSDLGTVLDIYRPINTSSILLVPIFLTVPDDPVFAHHRFALAAWSSYP